MDKNKIRTFAAWARAQLNDEIKEKLNSYKNKEIIIEDEKKIIEKAASVWFNRLMAIRYMEVNRFDFYKGLSLEEKSQKLKDLIPTFYGYDLPYIELLTPRNEFIYDKFFPRLRMDIGEKEFTKVEILGWLHQYFMAETKSRVYDDLKVNIKISKEDIPAATQLFTPRWIVQYLVENSLGRLWLEGKADEKRKAIEEKLKYYIRGNSTEEDAHQKDIDPETITILDPCMGSGHILLYCFELLYEIYRDYGYEEKEIPRKILENNLYGLDIDKSAMELATVSLMMKAREYDKNLFLDLEENPMTLNLLYVQDSDELLESLEKCGLKSQESIFLHDLKTQGTLSQLQLKEDDSLIKLLTAFKGAGELGSLLRLKEINLQGALRCYNQVNFNISEKERLKCEEFFKLTQIMTSSYTLSITNPPFLGLRGVNDTLAKYITKEYPDSKHDLCTVYMEVCESFIKRGGMYALINQHSWMFLGSFQPLRKNLVERLTFINMIHLGARAFEENVGTIVQNVAFVARKGKLEGYETSILDCRGAITSLDKDNLVQRLSRNDKEKLFYSICLNKLMTIARQPIAYWISDRVIKAFKECRDLGALAQPRQGMASSDNKRFLRYWYEVDKNNICFSAENSSEALESGKKWFPYRKGGAFRKWYGNNDFVVNWENDGAEVKEYAAKLYKSYTRTIKNENLYFKSCITYTFISEDLGVRYSPPGFVFDVAGSSIFLEDPKKEKVILGFMCSKVAKTFLDIMNPTYNIQVGDLKNIPVYEEMFKEDIMEEIIGLVDENIEISKADWDEREISWDFRGNPIVNLASYSKGSLKAAVDLWKNKKTRDVEKVMKNEERLNEIFISLYGLEKEIPKEVSKTSITLGSGNELEEIKHLISYGVGWILGRYNKASEENLIPLGEEDMGYEDLTDKFISFLSETFGIEKLQEKLEFIGQILEKRKDETDVMRLRRYFNKEFIKDHITMYRGKPIYWLFSSGKGEGFKALMYYHNYKGTELNTIRHKYLPLVSSFYEKKLSILNKNVEALKPKEKRYFEGLNKKLEEIKKYQCCIDTIGDEKITFNLDEGIEVNYSKLQNKEVYGERINLLHKI